MRQVMSVSRTFCTHKARLIGCLHERHERTTCTTEHNHTAQPPDSHMCKAPVAGLYALWWPS